MDRTLKIYLAVLIGVILLVIYIDSERDRPVNWSPTYSLDTKNPYDLYVLDNEIEKLTGKEVERVTVTAYEYLKSADSAANYLIIRNDVYTQLDSTLLRAVENGSRLFISATNVPYAYLSEWAVRYTDADPRNSLFNNDTARLSLTMSNWKGKSCIISPAVNTYCFSKINTGNTVVLGRMQFPDGMIYPNFIRVKHGKGAIFLHNQPQVFTNYNLLQNTGSAEYVAHALSYFPENEKIAWFVKEQTNKTGRPINTSALSVIFRYPALRAVWLLFLYGLLLFILFNAKRRQRIIPIIKPLRNTTVEFTQTIGNLYYQAGDVSNAVEKKIIFFLDKIRQKYYLDTHRLDDAFIDKLHTKSGKSKIQIRDLVHFINRFEKRKNTTTADLTELNHRIEQFWEQPQV